MSDPVENWNHWSLSDWGGFSLEQWYTYLLDQIATTSRAQSMYDSAIEGTIYTCIQAQSIWIDQQQGDTY